MVFDQYKEYLVSVTCPNCHESITVSPPMGKDWQEYWNENFAGKRRCPNCGLECAAATQKTQG